MTTASSQQGGKHKGLEKHKTTHQTRQIAATYPFQIRSKRDESAPAESSSVASLVVPSLFLGPCSAASSKTFLLDNAVSHVLSIGATPSKRFEGVTYVHIALEDSSFSSITKVCDTACEVIDVALNADEGNGKILVHCKLGVSRSPTVVAGYLMQRRGMSLREALCQIIQVRPQVLPNPGFLAQLKVLEMELRGEASLELDGLPKREKDRTLLLTAPDSAWKPSLDCTRNAASHTKLSSGRISRPPPHYLSRP